MRLPVSRSSRRSPSRSSRRSPARRSSAALTARRRESSKASAVWPWWRTSLSYSSNGLPLARSPQRGHLAAGDDGELERVLEGDAAPAVALADHAPALVDERQAAVEVVADDGEERLEPAPLDDRVGEALVDRERARELLELLAGEVRERRLRDGDERQLVRDGDRRERRACRPPRPWAPGRRGSRSRSRSRGRRARAWPVGARRRAARSPRRPTPSPVVSRNSPPSRNSVGSASSETWSQLTSLASPSAPAATDSSRPGMVRDVPNGQHVARFDIGAKRYAGTRREATGIPPPFLLRGQKRGRASGLRRPCRPWRCRAR